MAQAAEAEAVCLIIVLRIPAQAAKKIHMGKVKQGEALDCMAKDPMVYTAAAQVLRTELEMGVLEVAEVAVHTVEAEAEIMLLLPERTPVRTYKVKAVAEPV